MRKLQTLIVAGVFVFGMSGNASAGILPDTGWTNITNFLDTYANGYDTVSYLDFAGEWDYTAVAYEAGNTNATIEVLGGPTTFSTADLTNWGTWTRINFDAKNLEFRDISDGTNQLLDIFDNTTVSAAYFQLFKLTADSDVLSWLGAGYTLSAGTVIVGWNDNGINTPDYDYDDIIVALNPVPEPSTILLMGVGLAGIIGARRKLKK